MTCNLSYLMFLEQYESKNAMLLKKSYENNCKNEYRKEFIEDACFILSI